jgi:hypothetical protein
MRVFENRVLREIFGHQWEVENGVWIKINNYWGFYNWVLRDIGGVRVFENRVLRRIFGHKRNEITGEWRKFHNEELYDL